MTVTAMAKQLNVSSMTIYRRCKRNGINIEDYRNTPNGELSPEGVSVIASLFDTTGAEQGATDGATQTEHNAEREAQRIDAAVKIAELSATVDGLRMLVTQLEGERDELRRQLAQVTTALHAEQADRQQERLLLTGTGSGQGDGGQDQQRRGWFSRLFNR